MQNQSFIPDTWQKRITRRLSVIRLSTWCLVLFGLFSCQQEKSTQESNVDQAKPEASKVASNRSIDELEKAYQSKIDSIMKIQNQGNAEFQNQVAALTMKAEELETHNKNLGSQLGQQASTISKLRDSLQSAISEESAIRNTSFSPVALTEESLDTLAGAPQDTLLTSSYNALNPGYTSRAFVQEVDSLIQEVDHNKSQLAELDERLAGILNNLTIAVGLKNKKPDKGYEEVIINTLMSTISDDTLVVGQYKRGFYTKQDLNALIGDYQLRKTQKAVSGELVIYRRKKKQEAKTAVIYVEGKSYPFSRNKIDTISVKNVFDVIICDRQDNCNNMAFSGSMTNYIEVSLRKSSKRIDIKPVNQVLGQFYARQVTSSNKK